MRLTQEEVGIWKQRETRTLDPVELANMPVTWFKCDDGKYEVISYYPDDVWEYPKHRFTAATPANKRKINFSTLPSCFQAVLKEVMRDYDLKNEMAAASLLTFFKNVKLFLAYLNTMNVRELSHINPMHCANYVKHCREQKGKKGKPLKPTFLMVKLLAVETLQRLLAGTAQAFPHPWPDSSASHLAGRTGGKRSNKAQTLIIPDDQLAPLFQSAVEYLDRADEMLDWRDDIEQLKTEWRAKGLNKKNVYPHLNAYLSQHGYAGSLEQFSRALLDLQTACMVVILTLSGVRVHELCSLKNEPWYSVMDDEGERTYWMKGRSDKTHTGECEWLVSKLVTRALDVAQHYVAPLQDRLKEQQSTHREADTHGKKAHELRLVEDSLMLGVTTKKGNEVGVLSQGVVVTRLNDFAKACGVTMHLTPHQFRRTFAVYVAKSAFGDLRYLRDHFKHWSLDMTLLYALNEQQDAELYDEIMTAVVDEKVSVVSHWLEQDTLLSGGGAEQVVAFRNGTDAVKTFKERKDMATQISDKVYIRATGSAWCTSDNAGCAGRGVLENTRCGDCDNAIIDDRQTNRWKGIYAQQVELSSIDDIGEGGKSRIQRDLERCEKVLFDLGVLSDIRNSKPAEKKHSE